MINSINIPKNIKSQSTGNNDSFAQVFSQNYFQKIKPTQTEIFNFENPVYSIEGASLRYYAQSTEAVSLNLDNGKQYTIQFSANTFSISGLTLLNHELYRIDYENYIEAFENPSSSAFTETVKNNLSTPVYTFTDYASGATGVYDSLVNGNYTYTFPTRVKPDGKHVFDLFKDKSQYFINPVFVFPKPVDITIGDIKTYSGANIVTLVDYPKIPYVNFLESSLEEHTITGKTPFSGFTTRGAFFVYFKYPQKPVLNVGMGRQENPVVGKLATFSPTWNFNNVDDGSYYILEVSYNLNDMSFTDTSKVQYKIGKQDGDAEHVRIYSTPLLPNKKFLYRIGNTKSLFDIFGVERAVTAWTDAVEAETANDGRYQLSGHTYKNYIFNGNYDLNVSGYTGATYISGVTIQLNGVYSNSFVSVFVDSVTDNTIFDSENTPINSNVALNNYTITSDANGFFDFGRIDGGTYTMIVSPPAEFINYFPVQVLTVNINADTNMDIILSIIWGNTILDFMTPETFL